MLERLQAVGIINKTYKIPQKGERLNIYDIPINKASGFEKQYPQAKAQVQWQRLWQ